MTEKERLFKTFHKEKTDRPPCICPGGMMNMVTTDLMELAGVSWPSAHQSPEEMAALAIASFENGCFENIGVPFCMTLEAEGLGATVTMGNRINEPHVTDYCINSVEEWTKLTPFNLHRGRFQTVIDAIRIIKSRNLDAPIVANITGPVSTASSVMEPQTFYKQLRKKKEEAHAFLTFVTEQLIDFAKACVEAGADVVAISDPSGTGEILGPKFFEEYEVRYLNMLLDGIRKPELGTIVHICGRMNNVFPLMNQVRSDALSFDAIVSMREARENLPDRVLMGNISTFTLEFGDEEKIGTLVKLAKRDGSDIIAPACGLGSQSPIKNVQAILQTLKQEA